MSSNSVPSTNLNQVYSPELWAMESVAILFENAVSARLVNRDFENDFSAFGDVVNTRKPNEATANRKAPGDNIVKQAATAVNIPVKLNQHIESSFELTDEEASKSFKSLVEEFLRPHAISMARAIDRIVLGQYVQFMSNQAGSLGGLTTANAVQTITNAGLVLTRNKAPQQGRQMIWTPEAEALILQNAVFHEADKRGDTQGLIEASLGRKLKFDHWMDQNMSEIPAQTVVTETINNGNVTKGSTVLTIDAASAAIPVNSWITINGKVYQAAAAVSSSGTSLTLTYGLLEGITDGDEVLVQPQAAVDNAAGYAIEYAGWILTDNGSGALPPTLTPGQIVTMGGVNYVAIDVTEGATETSVLLDRPLEVAVADNAVITYGPGGGGLNFGFNPDALTLAIRPLAPPRSGAGAIGGIANFNDLTMRSVISYDSTKQTHIVTLDFLAGIKVLEPLKGVVVLT